VVAGVVAETPRVRTLEVDVEGWPGHRAGQHVDVRLTAEDAYQAQRSYSIASAPEEARLRLTVERIDDGEVSPYLVDVVEPGDRFEVRGPVGGWFVWDAGAGAGAGAGPGAGKGAGPGAGAGGGPLLLVGGGSGVVPLAAMLRHRVASGSDVPVCLICSSRSWDDVIYRAELGRLADGDGVRVVHTLTRSQPPEWGGYRRRVDADLLAAEGWPAADAPLCYICGPTGFVESVASALVGLGHDPGRIRTERFGPTGR
jgi:ferredoxin-NADP reductase